MSALAYSYPEPYRLPAGALALAVHALFFALLYFGVSWRTEQPQGMQVEIWESLPALQPAVVPEALPPSPPEPPKVEPVKRVEPPRPAPPPKADIALPDKKKPKAPEPKPVPEVKPQVQVPPKPMEPKVSEAELARQAAEAEQARARAAQEAAIGKVVDEHILRIRNKIRRYVVMPPDVPDDARAEFDVVLIPGGSVLSAKLVRPSGNKAYDDAVERAIMKAQPLPLPPDVALFSRFRELHLKFSPKDSQ